MCRRAGRDARYRPVRFAAMTTRDRRHPHRDPRGRAGRRARRRCRSRTPSAARSCGPTSRRCSTACRRRRRTRASRPHVEDFPLPELAPDEAFVAVMASAINFNTVWTSIFEPLPTFGFLKRLGKESVWGARHDQPFHVMGSDASGVVLRVGSAVRNWKPGDAVTVHCNHVDDQDPSAHDDSMMATNQRIWGFETNFGGLAEIAVVKANQLMPKPAHLTWEEAAVQRAVQLHELPHDREPERLADDAGPDGADLGRERRHRRVRVPVRAERRRHAGRRRVVAEARRRCCTSWASSTSSTARPRATSSGTTTTPSRTRRSGGGSARRSASSSAATPTSCSSTRAARRWARRCSSRKRGGMIITCAATIGLHDRVRQPLPLDEPQDAQGLPLRELPRGVGGQPADRARARSTRRCRRCTRSSDTGEAAYQVHHNLARGQARRAVPRARRRPRRHRPGDCASSTSTRSPSSADTEAT